MIVISSPVHQPIARVSVGFTESRIRDPGRRIGGVRAACDCNECKQTNDSENPSHSVPPGASQVYLRASLIYCSAVFNRVLLLSASAGAGHVRAADALEKAF